jgi:hypothetical protein
MLVILVQTAKLKANRVMNAVSNRGMFLGNNLGCIGLFYAGMVRPECSLKLIE